MQTGLQISKHKIRFIGQVLEIVEQVYEKIFLTQCLGLSSNHAELEVLPAQREIA